MFIALFLRPSMHLGGGARYRTVVKIDHDEETPRGRAERLAFIRERRKLWTEDGRSLSLSPARARSLEEGREQRIRRWEAGGEKVRTAERARTLAVPIQVSAFFKKNKTF